jgi:tRNA G37 N-methylase TrmD
VHGASGQGGALVLIEVVTLFPDLIREALAHGILGRSQ